jgi:TrmH family RNA methyltransferase
MEVITSLDNKRIKNYAKLLNKKYRDEEGMFLVEGEHLVIEASKAGCLIEVIKCEDYEMDFDVTTTLVTYEVIKKLSNTLNPQKVIGVCKKLEDKEIGNKVLLLEDIQDPGNLGTIIRSSLAFNVHDIILSKNTVDLYNDKVIRSSQGMIFKVNVLRCDLVSKIGELKDKNYLILGTDVVDGVDVRSISVNKFVLVMGNEGSGVSKEIKELCDKNLYINMNKDCESLNVGVATSILLYELNR